MDRATSWFDRKTDGKSGNLDQSLRVFPRRILGGFVVQCLGAGEHHSGEVFEKH